MGWDGQRDRVAATAEILFDVVPEAAIYCHVT